MENLIDRYINDVTRRLPEKDRDEVSKELDANIHDMLSEKASKNELIELLNQFGNPAKLAEKYRPNPQYLISPLVYDHYMRVLKWGVPLVGVLSLVIGLILGGVAALNNQPFDIVFFMTAMLSEGISLSIGAIFQVLFWTTIGFVISERIGEGTAKNKNEEWTIEKLPEIPTTNTHQISLSDSITELMLTLIFATIGILVCNRTIPFIFTGTDSETQVANIFSQSFLSLCIPAILLLAFTGICEIIVKIKDRSWTFLVCSTVIICNLISMITLLYLVNLPNIFSPEFIEFTKSKEWGSFDFLHFIGIGGKIQSLS